MRFVSLAPRRDGRAVRRRIAVPGGRVRRRRPAPPLPEPVEAPVPPRPAAAAAGGALLAGLVPRQRPQREPAPPRALVEARRGAQHPALGAHPREGQPTRRAGRPDPVPVPAGGPARDEARVAAVVVEVAHGGPVGELEQRGGAGVERQPGHVDEGLEVAALLAGGPASGARGSGAAVVVRRRGGVGQRELGAVVGGVGGVEADDVDDVVVAPEGAGGEGVGSDDADGALGGGHGDEVGALGPSVRGGVGGALGAPALLVGEVPDP